MRLNSRSSAGRRAFPVIDAWALDLVPELLGLLTRCHAHPALR